MKATCIHQHGPRSGPTKAGIPVSFSFAEPQDTCGNGFSRTQKKDGDRGGVRPFHSEDRPEAQTLFMLQGPSSGGEGALFALAADHGERSEQSELRAEVHALLSSRLVLPAPLHSRAA